MNIVLSSDNSYEIYLTTCIASILKNAAHDDNFDFYIFDGGISVEGKQYVESLKKIKNFNHQYIIIDNEQLSACKVPEDYHFSIATYYRFLIAEKLSNESRALYLDIDMIILNSLRELYETNLDGYAVGAIKQSRGGEADSNLRLGLAKNNAYFNGGVLLIDLEKWRELNVFDGLIKTATEIYDKILWVDQDVLNVFFENNYKKLDRKWNYESEFVTDNTHCTIVHYQGGDKFGVWASKYLHEYVALTPYRKFPKEFTTYLITTKKTLILSKIKNLLYKFIHIERSEKEAVYRFKGIQLYRSVITGYYNHKYLFKFLFRKTFLIERYMNDNNINLLYDEYLKISKTILNCQRLQSQTDFFHLGEITLLCDKYGSDKGSVYSTHNPQLHPYSWNPHSYSYIYEQLFSKIKYTATHIFECGIGTNNEHYAANMTVNGKPGASLRVWRDFFVNAHIYGADIDNEVLFQENRITTKWIDQTSPNAIKEYFMQLNVTLDIIIDDGLHTSDAAICLFENTFSYVKKNGFYIIEDLYPHCVQEVRDYLAHRDDLIANYILMNAQSQQDNNLIIIVKK